jgi:hypothetical protein
MPLIPNSEDFFQASGSIKCYDMRGKLITIINQPAVPFEYGNIVRLVGSLYVVKGICVIHGRLNINFEEIRTANGCQ